MSSARDITRLFRTLSDETRFRLLRLLWREELTVNEIAAITQLAQPRISNHLKILKEEGLIVERRRGSWRHYRVDRDQVGEPVRALWPTLESTWKDDALFGADDKRLRDVLAARESDIEGTFFDQLAERWDEIRGSLFGDALGREVLRTFLPPGMIVADIGTGTGYMLELFGNRCEKLIAIDNSEAMLAAARQKARAAGLKNIEFRHADAAASPLAPGEAHVITVIQVLHHIEDPGLVIRSLARGLKPGGSLIISDFIEHQEQWLRTELQHRWSGFSRAQVTGWLGAAGLKLTSWDILPGRAYISAEGQRALVPDGFTAVARTP